MRVVELKITFAWVFLLLALANAGQSVAVESKKPSGHVQVIEHLSGCDEAFLELYSQLQGAEHLKRNFLNRTVSRPGDNRNFYHLANSIPVKDRLVFHVENAIFKQLKDKIFSDGELAASTTSLYKQIFMNLFNRNQLLTSHLMGTYADFKSLRLMFNENSQQIRDELSKVYQEASFAFEQAMGQYPELVLRFAKQSKLNGRPEMWHLAGFGSGRGSEADEAALAARAGRHLLGSESGPHIQDFRDSGVRDLLRAKIKDSEEARTELQQTLIGMPGTEKMLHLSSAGRYVLSESLMDLLRAVPARNLIEYEAILHDEIQNRFGVSVDNHLLHRMQDYYHALDALAPSIYLEKETTDMGIGRARYGLISVDQRGGGARNLVELSEQIQKVANDPKITASTRLSRAIVAARKGQQVASQRFEHKMDLLPRAQANRLRVEGDHQFAANGTSISGDDYVFAPNKPLEEWEKKDYVSGIAMEGIPSDYRVAFIDSTYRPNGNGVAQPIPSEVRAALVEGAHNFEKEFRRHLEGFKPNEIPYEQFKEMTVAVNFSLSADGSAVVNLIIGGRVTPHQLQLMRAKAPKVISQELGSDYRLGRVEASANQLITLQRAE